MVFEKKIKKKTLKNNYNLLKKSYETRFLINIFNESKYLTFLQLTKIKNQNTFEEFKEFCLKNQLFFFNISYKNLKTTIFENIVLGGNLVLILSNSFFLLNKYLFNKEIGLKPILIKYNYNIYNYAYFIKYLNLYEIKDNLKINDIFFKFSTLTQNLYLKIKVELFKKFSTFFLFFYFCYFIKKQIINILNIKN